MLNNLFDDAHVKYRSLKLFGSIVDEFDDWLEAQGYTLGTRQNLVTQCPFVEKYFFERKVRKLTDLTVDDFRKCFAFFKRRKGSVHWAVGCLRRFLHSRQLLLPGKQVTPFSTTIDEYRQFLMEARGLAQSTVEQHCRSASEFLQFAKGKDCDFSTHDLTGRHIERFITVVGSRVARGSLQHTVAHLRSFLRFLELRGEAQADLDCQIDTPRVYRLEQLPKALQWKTVCAFVNSIDRTSVMGLRDYAMFLMMTSYGMRCCDIADLKLDDIDWRKGVILLKQRKTGYPLSLPLTDSVAESLLAYLRNGRPKSNYRQVFLKLRAPISPMTKYTIGSAFRSRVRRGNLEIPYEGVHCLRHSFATQLLRQGMSLKAIGDVLGHRSTESTCVYLRLNVEELREAALDLPAALKSEGKI